MNDALAPPRRAGGLGIPFGAGQYDQSEFLHGRVGIILIIPESNGAIDANEFNWTQPQRDSVIAEVQAGMEWWRSTISGETGKLEFTYFIHDSDVSIGYEPIRRDMSDDPGQGLVLGAILTSMGQSTAPDAFTAMKNYNESVRRANPQLDWVTTIIVCHDGENTANVFPSSGLFAFAYLGGPILVQTYTNHGWGISNMDLVSAHEMGHIFYALDEYASAGIVASETIGYIPTRNGNTLAGGGDLNEASCIMRSASAPLSAQTSCAYTRHQMGLQDNDGDRTPDILDFSPLLQVASPPSTTIDTVAFVISGQALSESLANRNPRSIGSRNAMTLNQVDSVEYRLDSGAWQIAIAADGSFDTPYERFSASITGYVSGTHVLEVRAVTRVGHDTTRLQFSAISSYPFVSSYLDTSGPNAWYVNDTSTTGDSFTSVIGDHANNGATRSTPKRSISAVASLLTAGDTVFIDAGAYTNDSRIIVTVPGVTFLGCDSRLVIIDANYETGFWLRAAHRTRIQQVAIINADMSIVPAGQYSAAIFLEGADSVIVSHDSFLSNATGIWAGAGSDSLTVTHCWFGNATGGYGVYCETAPQAVVTYCSFAAASVAFMSHSDSATLIGNEFNNRTIQVDNTDSVTVAQNLMHGNSSFSLTAATRGYYVQNTLTGGSFSITDETSRFNFIADNSCTQIGGNNFDIYGESNTFARNAAYGSGGNGYGFWLRGSARFNTFTSNLARGKRNYGFLIQGTENVLDSNTARACQDGGFLTRTSGDTNRLERNLSELNLGPGFRMECNGNRLMGNRSRENSGTGFEVLGTANVLAQNIADSNIGYGAWVVAGNALTRNNIRTSPMRVDSGVYVDTNQVVDLTRTWWFSTDSAVISQKIWGPGRSLAVFAPFRLGVVDTSIGADTVAPSATSDLVSDTFLGRINLSWSAPSSNEDSHAGLPGVVVYRVYRSRIANSSDWGSPWAETTAAAFHDTDIATDTDYYYRVTALDGAAIPNQGFYSLAASARVVRVSGDVSGDSQINEADVALFRQKFRNPGAYDVRYDIGKNGVDGVINEDDFYELGRRFGQ